MWLWRFRVAYAENTGLGRERSRQYLAATVPRLVARGAAKELVDDDLAINGRPFASLNSQEAGDGYLLMIERNVALLWLLGFDADWEKLRGGVVAREREGSLSLPRDFDRPLAFLWPAPSRVVRRAMGLGHLLMRAYFEQLHMLEERPTDREEAADGHRWSLRKLKEERFGAELSANERDLMVRPLGLWTRQEMADVTWKTESLGCLLWALSFLPEMPGFDQPFHPEEVRENCPLGSTPEELEQRAILRGPRELARGDDLARLWSWRAGIAELMELRGENDVPKDLKQQLAGFALAAAEAGVTSRAIKGDLPVGDRAYVDVPQEQKWMLRSIALERHLAFAWLCGNVSDWDRGVDPPPEAA
jgi:hypothetical protein